MGTRTVNSVAPSCMMPPHDSSIVRRALILLAFAGCVRHLPDAASGDQSLAPLVIGRSPDDASVAPSDTGLPIDTSAMATRDAAVVWTGCHVDTKGHNGAPTEEYVCVVEQEPDWQAFDSGGPVFQIREPRTSDPAMKITVFRGARPVIGIQPSTSFNGFARIRLPTGVWRAASSASMGATAGTFRLTFTSVRAVRDAGLGAYELHGKVDAQLFPDRQAGVGYIDLHADF